MKDINRESVLSDLIALSPNAVELLNKKFSLPKFCRYPRWRKNYGKAQRKRAKIMLDIDYVDCGAKFYGEREKRKDRQRQAKKRREEAEKQPGKKEQLYFFMCSLCSSLTDFRSKNYCRNCGKDF